VERWRDPAILLVVFVVSRFVYFRAGVRFNARTLHWLFQYIEVDLLRHDLVRSLWYLHAQPPLFNLYLGLVLKAFGRAHVGAFWVSYMLLGVAFHLSMYFLAV